jgi:hypothetical protein
MAVLELDMADAIDVLIHLRQIEHVERLVLGRISVHGNFSMLPKFSVMSETRASLAAGTLAGEPGPRPPPPCPPRPCGGVAVAGPWPFPNAAPPSALMAAAPAAVLARNRRRFIASPGSVVENPPCREWQIMGPHNAGVQSSLADGALWAFAGRMTGTTANRRQNPGCRDPNLRWCPPAATESGYLGREIRAPARPAILRGMA